MIPNEVKDALEKARKWSVTRNPYATAYIDAVPEAVSMAARMNTDQMDALRTQILYVLCNLQGWRGDEAKACKKVLRSFSETK